MPPDRDLLIDRAPPSLVDMRDVRRRHADKPRCLDLLHPAYRRQRQSTLFELITQATGEEYERLSQ